MPLLGADMEAGTLVEWLKRPGEAVHRGDIVAVVDTQKGAIEIEVFQDGVIRQLVVEPGTQVPVGTVLAVIDGASGTADEWPAAPSAPPAVAARAAGPPTPTSAAAAVTPATRRRSSPAARQAARALAVDLATVTGTGPGGAITVADIERAAAVKTPPAPAAAEPADRAAAMRAAIAAAMSRSKREIPHFYLGTTIDMTRAESWLLAENARRPVTGRILPVVLLLKSTAHALVDVPELNGFWTDGAFRKGAGIHVGCAISLRDGGLVAPALHDVDRKDLPTLMTELRDLIDRTRRGSLRSSELADSTITVTNLGDMGVESTFGIIFPPQVALVGFGKITRRPWAVGDAVAVRPVMTANLSADHRAVDGHRGGLFLSALDRALQEPERL
jgi:pyruvate dehydrogenase E2 component (dihydrolipoamide acetyltransferase)